ncbi:preprotein translocase subunit SecG [Candidatus Dojkabacteria bacterium]|nr:preprotein translocase subunit SecG [Candidatus Dojkabacteria bacterium]
MDLTKTLSIVEIVVGILLVVVILLQQRGSGLGTMFGGGGGEVYRSKRGIEKFLYSATIILAVMLVAIAVAIAILKA